MHDWLNWHVHLLSICLAPGWHDRCSADAMALQYMHYELHPFLLAVLLRGQEGFSVVLRAQELELADSVS